MIVIPFVPGTFASTIEYVLRNFTTEYEEYRVLSEICSDGSMHGFGKLLHTKDSISLQADLFSALGTDKILTPIYPFPDMHADAALKLINELISVSDFIICPYVSDLAYAEINMLFQYHKIATGDLGIGIFCGNNQHNIIDWDKNYKNWTDMENWELREWLSMFYVTWVQEWMTAVNHMSGGFKIKTSELLNATEKSFRKIIDHCELTVTGDIKSFADTWRLKQQYVLDEYNLINDIVNAVMTSREFSWSKLNIIAESIIQQKLRSHGFEIRCWGLNEFPTDTKILVPLLEKL
jgi:hypothetical protein